MNQQQKPNTQMPPNPPQNPMPDHRLQEMQERLRTLELQNQQLRTSMDYVTRGQQNPQAPATQQSKFNPEVETAIRDLVQAQLAPIHTQYRQQIGFLADKLDQANFDLHYGGDKFAPYRDKVEHLRQREQAQGRYISREDALRMVYFEETGRKNVQPQQPQQPAQEQAQQQPKFDPFFNAYVDPKTGLPLQPGQQAQPEQQPPQPGAEQQVEVPQNPQQQFNQPPANQPQFGQMQPGVPQQGQHPYGNAYGQQFQLPNQGVNTPAMSSQPNARAPLDLATASAADLEAFEKQFGDIPL